MANLNPALVLMKSFNHTNNQSSFSLGERQEIEVYTTQCPYQGGRAVYRARYFISLFDDAKVYDDDKICYEQGYERMAKKESIKTLDFILKPNPANDKVEISLMQVEDGICNIRISDLLGHPVLTKSFDCKLKQTILDVQTLVSGMYIIEVQKNNVWNKTEKLIINR